MDILNTDWLVNMLKKSSKTPHGRLLSLFDILNDWTNLPSINALGITSEINLHAMSSTSLLQNYLSLEAAKAGVALPEMLATQLYMMALSACHEKMQARLGANIHAGAGDALIHAKSAAQALISAQTTKEFRIAKSSAYAIAASVVAILFVAGSTFFISKTPIDAAQTVATLAKPASQSATISMPVMASVEDTTALFAQIELMRKGSCQLPEALQLPDSYKKVYFENIVLGQISTNPSDQKLVRELLKTIRCNYTPMLMAKSK